MTKRAYNEAMNQIEALESFIDKIENDLVADYAMEADGVDDDPLAKAREAKDKMNEGLDNGDKALYDEGVAELNEAEAEAKEIAKKDPVKGKKILIGVGAVASAAAIALGVVAGVEMKKFKDKNKDAKTGDVFGAGMKKIKSLGPSAWSAIMKKLESRKRVKAARNTKGDQQLPAQSSPATPKSGGYTEEKGEESMGPMYDDDSIYSALESVGMGVDDINEVYALESYIDALTDELALEALLDPALEEDTMAEVKDTLDEFKEEVADGGTGEEQAEEIMEAVEDAEKIKDPERRKKMLKKALAVLKTVAKIGGVVIGSVLVGKKIMAIEKKLKENDELVDTIGREVINNRGRMSNMKDENARGNKK